MFKQKGFTLIELLVVVLIIGILAAIAVPQYKKAVYKSRYSTLKTLVKNITDAETLYYTANGKYTGEYTDLDINLPSGGVHQDHIVGANRYDWDWGWCQLTKNDSYMQFYCVSKDRMELEITCNNPNQCIKLCAYRDSKDGLSDIRDQICQEETGRNTPTNGFGYLY